MKPITAILYSSNTGFTEKYARMLAHATGIPAYSLLEKRELPPWGSSVLYLGWVCAGKIKGLAGVRKRYQVQAVCAVGMAPADSKQSETLPSGNHLNTLPFFYLQGGYAPGKLTGLYRLMMIPMTKMITKKPPQNQEERSAQDAFRSGGDWVTPEALSPALAWMEAQK